MNLLFFISNYDGCGYYRVQMPARYLNKLPDVHAVITTKYSEQVIQWADVVILQKQYMPSVLPYVKYAKKLGKKVVYEVDDDYLNIPTWNPAHKHYWDKAEELIAFYKEADAITVTTKHLKKQLSPYNSNIHVLPNYLDYTLLDRLRVQSEEELFKYNAYADLNQQPIELEDVKEKMEGKFVIGWGGSPTHYKDVDQATEALLKITNENDDVLVMFMASVTDKIITSMNPDRFILVKPVPIFLYPQVLYTMNWDLGICPIKDNTFNRSKSNLKFLEFSNAGYPCICSAVENYANTVVHGETGLLVENTDESWFQAISEMKNNETLRQSIKEKALEQVRADYNMADHFQKWLKVYSG